MQFLTSVVVLLPLLIPALALPAGYQNGGNSTSVPTSTAPSNTFTSTSATATSTSTATSVPSSTNGLDLIQQLELAATAADRLNLLKDDDFIFSFNSKGSGAPGVTAGKG